MLRGLATVGYVADDVPAAAKWYADFLGIEPYFLRPDAENPAYVEFRVGDYEHELGILDRRYATAAAGQPGSAAVAWHVDDIDAALERLIAMGATAHEPKTVMEGGFVSASVLDPFGNVLGLTYNPHYLDVLARDTKHVS
ncbi:VOC family protein [Kibdelosporangium philippinense]|uniref:VOC family protein n=1 Tax=Kibdelosporangium philippinense TaxID=211113 RepID=A0ABS8ZCN3_9PSEU|nr:VOC family protein [Kibdelosporangium philippinense]MCE7004293.1 VOC family protein [Kibdelosporangium philippinense]